MEHVLKFVGGMVVSISTAILRGWVLVMLWGWFVIPVFEDAPRLTIPAAIGLSYIVFFVTAQYIENPSDRDLSLVAKTIRGVGYSVMLSIAALAFGFVVHLFM